MPNVIVAIFGFFTLFFFFYNLKKVLDLFILYYPVLVFFLIYQINIYILNSFDLDPSYIICSFQDEAITSNFQDEGRTSNSQDEGINFSDYILESHHNKVTTELGIVYFDNILANTLEKYPYHFLSNLFTADSEDFIKSYWNNPTGIEEVINTYNELYSAQILKGNLLLTDVIRDTIDKATYVKGTDFLSLHALDKWVQIYGEYLQSNPLCLGGSDLKYTALYDTTQEIWFLLDRNNYDTFFHTLNELKKASNIIENSEPYKLDLRSYIDQGIALQKQKLMSNDNQVIFKKAFNLEREFNRLNKISNDVFR